MRLSSKARGKSRFFLLHQQAMTAHKAARAFSDLMRDFTDVDAKAEEIAALGRLAGEMAQQTSLALRDAPPDRRFLPIGAAIGRGDAAQLAERLHGMAAAIAQAAAAAPSDDAGEPPDAVTRLAGDVVAAARELEKGIGALSAGGGAAADSLSWAFEAAGLDDAVPARWRGVSGQLAAALESGRAAGAGVRAMVGKG